MTNDFGKSTAAVTRQKGRLTIRIFLLPRSSPGAYTVARARPCGERVVEREKKERTERGIGFFRLRAERTPYDRVRSMVGGAIKDPGLCALAN